ncbi:hypothetical protein A0H81_12070 [Grifola frondosa]|uniref:Uncharacterized protein n=1 Tax=Grifola frondosa TaxID=5627 RepID=A0A1C7LXV2_GRIFR|nr:hypothetical protein A0H81_12070 [Grifola frondosa]
MVTSRTSRLRPAAKPRGQRITRIASTCAAPDTVRYVARLWLPATAAPGIHHLPYHSGHSCLEPCMNCNAAHLRSSVHRGLARHLLGCRLRFPACLPVKSNQFRLKEFTVSLLPLRSEIPGKFSRGRHLSVRQYMSLPKQASDDYLQPLWRLYPFWIHSSPRQFLIPSSDLLGYTNSAEIDPRIQDICLICVIR